MTSALTRVLQAARFAAEKHAKQKRKGKAREPYVNHLIEVAALLTEATRGHDPNLIIAGLLHDVIEDQRVPKSELKRRFGADIANLVSEVTDDKSFHKQRRKSLQILNAPGKSRRAKMIKIADKCSNLRSLRLSPPTDWSAKRRRAYVDWAQKVVAGCRGVNKQLEATFDNAAAALIPRPQI